MRNVGGAGAEAAGSRLPGARRRRAGRRRRSPGQTRGQQERRGSLKEFHPARFLVTFALGLGNPSKDPRLKSGTFQTALPTTEKQVIVYFR